MRKRILVAAMLVVALVAAGVAVAQADLGLTLSASPTAVTYPHRSLLTVGLPSGVTTAAILAMPAGASTWTTVSANTRSTLTVRPRHTTAYEALTQDGTTSAPVTVTVAARLTKPQLPGSIRKNRTITIKGTMAPGETSATVTVEVYRNVTTLTRVGKGKLKKSTSWGLYVSMDIALKVRNANLDAWSLRWKPTEIGQYKIVVSHVDAMYAASSAVAFTRVRK
jgi:hypothetical protein